MKPDEVVLDKAGRLKYCIAIWQEDRFGYLSLLIIEGIILWSILVLAWAGLNDLISQNPSGDWSIFTIPISITAAVLLVQTAVIYSYRGGSKYIFQNTIRMLNGAETKRLRKKKRITQPHDLSTYYWRQFEAVKRYANFNYQGHIDDLFDLAKDGFEIENPEHITIEDVAMAIEIGIVKESSKTISSAEDSWRPFHDYAERYLQRFGDTEPPVWEWLRFIINEYVNLEKSVKLQELVDMDESRFEAWKREFEEHTNFYLFVVKIAVLILGIGLAIILGPDILKLLSFLP